MVLGSKQLVSVFAAGGFVLACVLGILSVECVLKRVTGTRGAINFTTRMKRAVRPAEPGISYQNHALQVTFDQKFV